jgi:glutamine amidotransferase
MLAVLDYGIGNLASAEKALARLHSDVRLVRRPEEAEGAAGVVLPGVGAFGACARALAQTGLAQVARQAIAAGTPFLGICVGFQLLFEGSDEAPGVPGLGLLAGRVRRLAPGVKHPQMQWNRLDAVPGRASAMLAGLGVAPWFYFVHSYAPVPEDERIVVATCDYGGPVVAAVEVETCWGTQFHPEKSGRAGLSLLANFVRACEASSTGLKSAS